MSETWQHATTGSWGDGRSVTGATALVPQLVVLLTPQLDHLGEGIRLGGGPLSLNRGSLRTARGILIDPNISRRQGQILQAESGLFTVVDAGSRNGTWVNGDRLEKGAPRPLQPGDRVGFGNTWLLYDELPADGAAWELGPALEAVGEQIRDDAKREVEIAHLTRVHGRLMNESLVGTSIAMRQVRQAVLTAARRSDPVLITGPTGTGKEAIARAIHDTSQRRKGGYVAFSCAEVASDLMASELFGVIKGAFTGADASRSGIWRSAHHGTLFMDEMGDASTELQAGLLRVIESGVVRPVGGTAEHKVDVRLVTATKRDLDDMVEAEEFRDDLFYRLTASRIQVAPLSARPADALLLFGVALRRQGLEVAVVDITLAEALWRHAWPGGGREVIHLAASLRARAAKGSTLRPPASFEVVDRPDAPPAAEPAAKEARRKRTTAPTREALVALLDTHDGNISAVAKACGVRRQQIYRWCDRMEIPLPGR